MIASHVLDPYAAAMEPGADLLPHLSECASCAYRVLSARHFLRKVRSAAPPMVERELPDASRIRDLARRRRVARQKRTLALAASLMALLLGVTAMFAQESRQRSIDLADDALLRTLPRYHEAPDIGGLGSLVAIGIDENGRG